MAVSQGSSALKSDLINWYTVFNNFIASYGGDIPQLPVPDGSKIRATDVNALYTKTNEFKADEYLKAEPDLWISGTAVTSGTLIRPAQITDSINRTITNMGVVKCRNNATNYFGANANGYNNCGTKYCGMKTNIVCANGLRQNELNSSGARKVLAIIPCTNGINTCGSNSNGRNGHTNKSHGDKSNTTVVDLRNANSSKTNN